VNPVPFTTEAEAQAESDVIGICVAWPERVHEIDLQPEHFGNPRWRTAFEAIRSLERENRMIDHVTVQAEIERRYPGQGDQLMLDMVDAARAMPSGDHAVNRAELVRGGAIRRAVATICAESLDLARKLDAPEALLSELLQRIARLHVEQPSDSTPIYDLVKERYIELSRLLEDQARGIHAISGVPSGIGGLDDLIGGFQRGICTVVAGRPGMGKSAFGITCVRNASRAGMGCHVFSLEDTRKAYTDRVIAADAQIAAESLRTLKMNATERGQLHYAMGNFQRDVPWLVEDRAGITADEIVRTVRRKLKQNKTQMVVVDYVQLIHPPRDVRRGEEAVSYAMHVLADAAKQDDIAYLVLSQLSRECEKRDDKRPILSDLKQAGTIEERAKAVVFLFRPAVYEETDPDTRQPIPESVMEILIAKNNQGRTGRAFADWNGKTMEIR
jgi:replicative DNA helicase